MEDACSAEHTSGLTPGVRYLHLTVEDEGSGIPSEIRDRLFEPFFTTKERGRGTGLGLAMVYGIVQQWDGHVAVDSEPGRGTRFSVYLPSTAGVPDEAPAAPAPSGQALRGRVLVVEDEVELLRMVCRILSHNGYDPVAAASPAEAMEILNGAEGEFDVLLTDVVMPGGSGPELSIEARRTCPDLRVIFMSGYAGDMLDRHGTALSNDVLLSKPFSADQLVRQLRETLEMATRP
jgi:CheY-like chemotaxis protein